MIQIQSNQIITKILDKNLELSLIDSIRSLIIIINRIKVTKAIKTINSKILILILIIILQIGDLTDKITHIITIIIIIQMILGMILETRLHSQYNK